ncbi:MAG: type III secretion system inner membrane ring subunit SctD [Deltaproteobacteria bacterium]|jgi:type III secretion protein D|nr:type III secretion system inner membrane ring subunit SctD [Deltaproteobacteria bacterium]
MAGPNLGASIALGVGKTIIGSGDESDLILRDRSLRPKHLELDIAPDGPGAFIVLAKPLEGQTRLDGEVLEAQGRTVKPGQVISLGFSALVYGTSESDFQGTQLVPLAYARSLAPERAESLAELSAESGPAGRAEAGPEPGGQPAEPEVGPMESSQAEGPEGSGENLKIGKKPREKSRLGLLGLVLVVAALLLLVFGPARKDKMAEELSNQRTLLQSNGFEALEVVRQGSGLEAYGELESDAELSRLVELVKGRPTTVFLRISVKKDLLEAARQALNSYGFYPALFFDNQGRPTVTAYMLNQGVEDKVFEDLAKDVPALEPVKSVVHREVLEPILLQELVAAGLADIQVTFREGFLELAVGPGFEQGRLLAQTFNKIAGRVGVPVVYSLSTLSPQGAPALEEAAPVIQAGGPEALVSLAPGPEAANPVVALAEPENPNDPASFLDVVGVTLSPMRFVSTRDGQKLFEGSTLPGGWVITTIEARTLTLARGEEALVVVLGQE